MYKYLLFDLDGTITKSEEGIFNCMKYAMDWAGIPYPAPEVFRSFIGPSLYDSFANTLHMDDAQAKEMVAKYRERYAILVREEFSCLEFIMNRDTINWILKKLNTGGRTWSIYQRKSIKTASATRWWETTTFPI